MPVFTQFADTSRYLKTQLTIRGFRRVEEATGESANPTELVWRFSPESNAKRHLISPLPLGEGPGVRANFSEWRKSHQPFHWFAEFYGVMREGGFDVVIGNPPYVQIRQLNNFKEGEFVTFACGNIYTLVIERCLQIISLTGKQGLIVPVSSISTEG
ncbi:MAG: Eco57I restriction-modification methylase domain-containing protein [Methylococcales bacterium]